MARWSVTPAAAGEAPSTGTFTDAEGPVTFAKTGANIAAIDGALIIGDYANNNGIPDVVTVDNSTTMTSQIATTQLNSQVVTVNSSSTPGHRAEYAR